MDILKLILNALFGFKKGSEPINDSGPQTDNKIEPKAFNEELSMDNIDWTNPACKISKYFTVKEALWLNKWNRMANEQDGLNDTVKANLLSLFKKMDIIRDYIAKPIIVHVTYRPKEYNKLIGGATHSAHLEGLACDFSSDITGDHVRNGQDCDKIKEMLIPCLEQWGLRLEDNGKGSGWCHVDLKEPGASGSRYFKP